MTREEAIEDLEARKAMLMNSCITCWDEAIEMALKALKTEAIPVAWIERYQLNKGYSPGGQIDRMIQAWRKGK